GPGQVLINAAINATQAASLTLAALNGGAFTNTANGIITTGPGTLSIFGPGRATLNGHITTRIGSSDNRAGTGPVLLNAPVSANGSLNILTNNGGNISGAGTINVNNSSTLTIDTDQGATGTGGSINLASAITVGTGGIGSLVVNSGSSAT